MKELLTEYIIWTLSNIGRNSIDGVRVCIYRRNAAYPWCSDVVR